MQNFITLNIGNFQQLMEDSIRNKEKTLREDCVPSKFVHYDCIFRQGDTRHIFTQYMDFILRAEDSILNNYKDIYNVHQSINHYCIELQTVSIDIPTYMFALSNNIVPKDFDFNLYIGKQVALRRLKEKYKDA